MNTLRKALKTVLPASTQRTVKNLRARLLDPGLTSTGRQNWVPHRRWVRFWGPRAARRLLAALILKTDDMLTVRWLGRPIYQYPLDAWLIQEMVGEIGPELIIETGTWLGGSAFFYANLCDLMGQGEVISIDLAPKGTMPHPRITYITGSSVDPAIVSIVAKRVSQLEQRRVLVILDSDHTAGHVLKELEAYAPFVHVGGYVHVQDGSIDELPIFKAFVKRFGPGPTAAVKAFLSNHPSFIRDIEVEERYIMTAHPYGWLKKIAQ